MPCENQGVTIMWHDVVVIWQLVDDVVVDNWLMMWTLCISR